MIFGRLCLEISAPFPPVFFGLETSDVFAGSLLLSLVMLVEEEMVEAVEEEAVDADLERKDRSCLSFLSLNRVKAEMRMKSKSQLGEQRGKCKNDKNDEDHDKDHDQD